jgi:hypothetical protein
MILPSDQRFVPGIFTNQQYDVGLCARDHLLLAFFFFSSTRPTLLPFHHY